MPVITFIEFDGTEHQVDADAGVSVMETALKHNIPGIDADCGGIEKVRFVDTEVKELAKEEKQKRKRGTKADSDLSEFLQ